MANANKAKGTRWETAIVRYLHEQGFTDARRVVQQGRADTGDIHVRDFVIQAKAYNNVADGVRAGMAKVAAQRTHAGFEFGVAVVKRPRMNVRDGLVVMSLQEFARLLRAYYPDAPG